MIADFFQKLKAFIAVGIFRGGRFLPPFRGLRGALNRGTVSDLVAVSDGVLVAAAAAQNK